MTSGKSNHSSDVITLSVADLPVTLVLSACDSETRARIIDRYEAFVVPMLANTPSIRVRVEPGSNYIPYDIAPTWQIKTTVQDGRIEFESYLERGWVDRTTGQGELVMRPRGDPENYLRVLYAWLCLEQEGLLLHASGVIWREKGYVFFGPSGSGKTTVSQLSLDRTVLSDDLVIIKKQGDAFRLYGVPFRGDMPEAPRVNASAELCGLFALVKDAGHRVVRLPMPDAVARLAACVPFVMTQSSTRQVVQLCENLAARVPVHALHFQRNSGFWEVIDGLG